MAAVIEAQDVSKRFVLRHNPAGSVKERFLALIDPRRRETAEEFWALRHVSATISEGEAVGLIGRNGSGKSTFLRLVAGIHRADGGRMLVRRGARIGSMIELGVGFHGELNGAENLRLNAAVNGLTRAQIDAVYDRVVDYAGLREFMDVPLKNFSSGMIMRLGFAIAVNLDPDVLLIDEIFAVGDADFQQQCVGTMQQFREQGKTIVFVSHNPAAVRTICQRVCLLERGQLVYDGKVDRGFSEYQKLLSASIAGRRARQAGAGGGKPRPDVTPWHRVVPGGRWEEAGLWQFEFLKREGLRPHHFVLDMGCGSLAGAFHLLQHMEPHRYWGVETNRAAFDAGVTSELVPFGVAPEAGHFVINDRLDLDEIPHSFDFAIAHSLFTRLPLNQIPRVIVEVLRKLEPGGRFYATWFENPVPASFDPIEWDGGLVTYPDAEPYHYPFVVLAKICEALGIRAERVDDPCHPRGESVMVITRA
jgi:ABC-type polysaccharide/polyol phosphate transport system ATPase subunit